MSQGLESSRMSKQKDIVTNKGKQYWWCNIETVHNAAFIDISEENDIKWNKIGKNKEEIVWAWHVADHRLIRA